MVWIKPVVARFVVGHETRIEEIILATSYPSRVVVNEKSDRKLAHGSEVVEENIEAFEIGD